jgi:hypothetical protein
MQLQVVVFRPLVLFLPCRIEAVIVRLGVQVDAMASPELAGLSPQRSTKSADYWKAKMVIT